MNAAEIDTFRVEAGSSPQIDHRDVHKFTAGVLDFWRKRGDKMPTWRKAAKKIFTIPPTLAASERVFSLLEAMFGPDQDQSLSDLIQGAITSAMLGEWRSVCDWKVDVVLRDVWPTHG